MTATTPTTALIPVQPVFTDSERLALAGFLAGYRGLTREAYTLDLRQFTNWCRSRSLSLFSVRRADIETLCDERGDLPVSFSNCKAFVDFSDSREQTEGVVRSIDVKEVDRCGQPAR